MKKRPPEDSQSITITRAKFMDVLDHNLSEGGYEITVRRCCDGRIRPRGWLRRVGGICTAGFATLTGSHLRGS
jgi:hypothetical protein